MRTFVVVLAVVALTRTAVAGKYGGIGLVGPPPPPEHVFAMDLQAAVTANQGPSLDPAVELAIVHSVYHDADPVASPPRYELQLAGVSYSLREGRTQLRSGAGYVLGPAVVAVNSVVEWSDAGRAWALGPELRFRYRIGADPLRTLTIGIFVRADAFVHDRATHDDRFALGVFGRFGHL